MRQFSCQSPNRRAASLILFVLPRDREVSCPVIRHWVTTTMQPVRGAQAPTSLSTRPSFRRLRRLLATFQTPRLSQACGRLTTRAQQSGGVPLKAGAPPLLCAAPQPWRTSGLQEPSPRSPGLGRDRRRLRPLRPLPLPPRLNPARRWPTGWQMLTPLHRPLRSCPLWGRCAPWANVPLPKTRALRPRVRWSGAPQ